MNHAAIKARYEARMRELRRLPYSRANDSEELACKQVIDAIDAFLSRTTVRMIDQNAKFAAQHED